MLRRMRTTVRLEPNLLDRARREAARRGTTLTALIEQGLQTVLRRPVAVANRPRIKLPISPRAGGVRAGIDLDDSSGLADVMDGRR
jgi:hypothetical protein